MKKLILLILILVFINMVYGANYYISNSGDDTNDGLSPEEPFKTVSKLNSMLTNDSQTIYFKGGDRFSFAEDTYFSLGKGAYHKYITSYGTGKALITGSYLLDSTANWTCGGNYCNTTKTFPRDIGNIIYIDLSAPNSSGTNATANNKSNTFAGMNAQGEYYYNPTTDRVYMYSPAGNPHTLYGNIEFAEMQGSGGTGGIFFCRKCENITFDNIDIRYGGQHGLDIRYADRITVKNSHFEYNGGCFQSGVLRLGNDIQVYGNNSNWIIYNNTFSQTYDTPIAIQQATAEGFAGFYNITVSYNIVTHSGFSGLDYFSSYADSITDNITWEHNTVYNVDGGWAYRQRPDQTPYGVRWDRTNAQTTNFIVRNNIIANNRWRAMTMGTSGSTYWKGEFESNYNLYQNDASGNMFTYNGTTYTSLANLKAGYPNIEVNSIQQNPSINNITSRPSNTSFACNMSSTGSFVGALPCESYCGNEVCEYDENCNNCVGDCGSCATVSCMQKRSIFCNTINCYYNSTLCSESSNARANHISCNKTSCVGG